MARPVIYPPEIRKSQSWKRLYSYWKKVRSEAHAPAFDNFMNFYNWAMNNGYADNRKLRKVDPSRPWVPDNGTWLPIEPGTGKIYGRNTREAVVRWNETVNRLRIHYGMKPFPLEEEAVC
jgi:hypothetical protein